MYIHIHIYIYIYIHGRACAYVHIYIYIYIYKYTCIHTYIHNYITTTVEFPIIVHHSRCVNLWRDSSSVRVSYFVNALIASSLSSGVAWSGQGGVIKPHTYHLCIRRGTGIWHASAVVSVYMCLCLSLSLSLSLYIYIYIYTICICIYRHTYIYIHMYAYMQTYTLGRHGCLMPVISGGEDQDAMSCLIVFWLCIWWALEIPTKPMPSCTVQMPCTSSGS